MSVVKKCFNTVEPKEPVPPVMTKVLFLNASVILFIIRLSSLAYTFCYVIFLFATENIASVYIHFTLITPFLIAFIT